MAAVKTQKKSATAINGVEGKVPSLPVYRVRFTLLGTSPILFHRYNVEHLEWLASLPKGDARKKMDHPHAYVYRNEQNQICYPGLNIHSCLIDQARSKTDPRSPRKSARDLMKAAICPDDDLILFNGGVEDWDFLDKRRCGLNGGSAVTRVRPALLKGWTLEAHFTVLQPGYIDPGWLLGLINDAGAYMGLGDFRPVFGRFQCTNFEVLNG